MGEFRNTGRLPMSLKLMTISRNPDPDLLGDGDWPRFDGPPGRIPAPGTSVQRHSRRMAWIRSISILIALAIPLYVLLIAGAVYWQARTDEARPADAIIVLGAAQYNGRPSPVLSARLEHALRLYDHGVAPLIVLTGGRAEGDVYTEAEAGQTYLEERGVPASALLLENQGRDTWTSLEGVATLLSGTEVHRIVVVSDGFHLLRAELMARHLGFEAYSSAAPDSAIRPWSGTELSYVIRETGGIIEFLPKMF